MKIKFNSDNNLSLNKMLKLPMLTVIVTSVFEGDGKYYPQFFLDECFYQVQILEFDYNMIVIIGVSHYMSHIFTIVVMI